MFTRELLLPVHGFFLAKFKIKSMDISWIKVKTEMFDDQKIQIIETLPESDSILIIWIKLLTMAGKINDGGLIYISKNMSYNEETLATVLKRKVSIVRLALKILTEFDMIEIYTSGQIGIVNWDKHQNIEGMEKIKEQNRIRQAKYRKKQKQKSLKTPKNKGEKGCVTLRVTENNGTEEERDIDIDIDIELIESQQIELKIESSFDVKDEILNQNLLTDSPEARIKVWLIYETWMQHESFTSLWSFYGDRYPEVDSCELMKVWVSKADWYTVTQVKINLVGGWIKRADQEIKKLKSSTNGKTRNNKNLVSAEQAKRVFEKLMSEGI